MLDRLGHLSAGAISISLLLAILLVSCSSSEDAQTDPTSPTASLTTATTTTPPAVAPTVTEAPSTTLVPITTSQPPTPATTTTLPGEPYFGPGPNAGDLVAVVGVAHDDVLFVRAGPRTSFPVTDSLEPTQTGIPVTGEAWLLPSAVWNEIRTGEGTGWANSAYLGLFGSTDDATLEVYGLLGEPIIDEDLEALGARVATAFLSDEGGGWIALVEPSERASTSDTSSITYRSMTYDVVGLSDDSIKGYRLVIHTTQDTLDSPFVLDSVERTYICWRGVDLAGVCV